MNAPRSRSLWRRVIAVALLLLAVLLPTSRAQSTVTFELPLGRFSHGFTLHYLDSNSNENTVSSPVSVLAPAGSVDGSGNYLLAADSHLEITFQADSSQFSQWWLSDDSVSAFSQPGAFDLRGMPWGQSPGAVAALSPALCFAVSADRLQHALVVVFNNGATIPVMQDGLLGTYVTAPDGSSAFQSYGFFNAVANTYGLAGAYYLVDLTTREQAPANSTELAFAAWAPLTLSTFSRTVRKSLALRISSREIIWAPSGR